MKKILALLLALIMVFNVNIAFAESTTTTDTTTTESESEDSNQNTATESEEEQIPSEQAPNENLPSTQTEIKKYSVVFFADEKIINTQIVEKDELATIPEKPTKNGYSFVKWNPDPLTTKISQDTVFIAEFKVSDVITENNELKKEKENLTQMSMLLQRQYPNKYNSYKQLIEMILMNKNSTLDDYKKANQILQMMIFSGNNESSQEQNNELIVETVKEGDSSVKGKTKSNSEIKILKDGILFANGKTDTLGQFSIAIPDVKKGEKLIITSKVVDNNEMLRNMMLLNKNNTTDNPLMMFMLMNSTGSQNDNLMQYLMMQNMDNNSNNNNFANMMLMQNMNNYSGSNNSLMQYLMMQNSQGNVDDFMKNYMMLQAMQGNNSNKEISTTITVQAKTNDTEEVSLSDLFDFNISEKPKEESSETPNKGFGYFNISGSVRSNAKSLSYSFKNGYDKTVEIADGVLREKSLGVKARSVNGEMFIPLKYLGDLYGIRTQWNPFTNEAIMSKDGATIKLGVRTGLATDNAGNTISISKPILSNGKTLISATDAGILLNIDESKINLDGDMVIFTIR